MHETIPFAGLFTRKTDARTPWAFLGIVTIPSLPPRTG
jgi:hypothetical protein